MDGTFSRAHASPTERMSHCPVGHLGRDIQSGTRDKERAGQDIPSPKGGRDIPSRRHLQCSASKKQAAPQGAATWMHIAAMNLLQDHEQGVPVNPMKLDAARKLLGKEAA